MTEQNKQKLNELWERLFVLQKQTLNGPLCLLDQLTYSDISQQIKLLSSEE